MNYFNSTVIVLAIAVWYFYPVASRDISSECDIKVEERAVRGNSLTPLARDGQKVRILFGYYDCHDIKRNDIVLYSYAGSGSDSPLIKIVRAVPGDSYKLQRANGGWHILINGEILKNSEGVPYLVSGKKYEMLALYEPGYAVNGVNENTYLILGEIPSGAVDSTRFGFISGSEIIAKAELASH